MSFVSSDHFVQVTSKMRKSGRLSDANIILDDGSTFKIHKMLLAMGISFFEKMCKLNMSEADSNKVER